jgi:hypothetical protein
VLFLKLNFIQRQKIKREKSGGLIENLCRSKGLEIEATMEHLKGQEHSQSQTVHWRIFIFSAILALTGLFCTPQLDAEIYQWVDENGVETLGFRFLDKITLKA